MSDIVIIGAGGHARVLVDALRAGGRDVAGFCSKDGDTASGKRTLAVLLGDPGTRRLYLGLVLAAWLVLLPVLPERPWAALTGIALPLAWRPCQAIRHRAAGLDLVPVLQDTGRLVLAYGCLLGLALAMPG